MRGASVSSISEIADKRDTAVSSSSLTVPSSRSREDNEEASIISTKVSSSNGTFSMATPFRLLIEGSVETTGASGLLGISIIVPSRTSILLKGVNVCDRSISELVSNSVCANRESSTSTNVSNALIMSVPTGVLSISIADVRESASNCIDFSAFINSTLT